MAEPQLLCQLYDHAKQYDNAMSSRQTEAVKLHGNISWNDHGKAIIGRYGGCFEEGIWWVYGTGEGCAVLETLVPVGPKQTVFSPFPRRHLEPSPNESGR